MDTKAYNEMIKLIDARLRARHWGCLADGKSVGKKPRFYIMDYRGFALATGIIRYYNRETDNVIFYRGQDEDWEIKPSFYRKITCKAELEEANKWREELLEELRDYFDQKGTDEEREALAQHYGLHTKFLDVVDNIQSALWFAYDNVQFSDDKFDASVGYVEVMAFERDKFQILDLRNKPSKWMRPHVQQGFCIKANKPDKSLGSLQKNLVLTFIVPKELLRVWSNYDNMPRYFFYPEEAHDDGIVFWNKAKKELESKGIDFSAW